MKVDEIIKTLENALELRFRYTPEIEENPLFLSLIHADGAVLKEDGKKILIKDKNDNETLSEELTHALDKQNSEGIRIRFGTKKDGLLSFLWNYEYYEDKFYDHVLKEALGYYGSKLITPERKPIDIRPILKELIETKNWELLKGISRKKNYEAHQIGYDLGEKLYNYMQRIGDKNLATALVMKNRERKTPFKVYKRILEQAI